MLTRIDCPRFRQKTISFHAGLNVVLGDNAGSNSIGKSCLLMVVDYAFGGTDLTTKMSNIVDALGHHHYDFSFQFATGPALFRRTTATPSRVYRCGTSFEDIRAELTLDEFSSWLAEQYQLDPREVSFRSCVSPFVRVWGRETLDVSHPLHAARREPSSAVQSRFLGIMGGYGKIDGLSKQHSDASSKLKALDAAIRSEIVPRIAHVQYRQNQQKQLELEKQLEQIRMKLAAFAVSIKDILSKEAAEISARKEVLLNERARQTARLARFQTNLNGIPPISARELEEIRALIPTINLDRLRTIEGFHRGLTQILSKEITNAYHNCEIQVHEIDTEIDTLNKWLQTSASRLAAPPELIENLLKLISEKHRLETMNNTYDQRKQLVQEVSNLRTQLDTTRQTLLSSYANDFNRSMEVIASTILSGEQKRPILSTSKASIELSFPTDKGTGSAFSGLLIFDIAALRLTPLPIIIEDSLLFANIQPSSMQRLIDLYASTPKQIFMAIDKVDVLYNDTASPLYEKAVTRLSREAPLYDKDWRSSQPEGADSSSGV